MRALAKETNDRPASASEWFESFAAAVSTSSELTKRGDSRLVIMAPSGAEVYVDDERYGSVGRSGRVILTSLAPGQHVLRVAKSGEPDDERVIEIRSDIAEQIIEAQLKIGVSNNQLSPSRGGSLDSKHGAHSTTLVVVMCTKCHSRFAEGVKFCGRCGNTTFQPVSGELQISPADSSAERSLVSTLPAQLSTEYQILRALWHSDRNCSRSTGARPSQSRCSVGSAAAVILPEPNSADAVESRLRLERKSRFL